MTADMHIAGFGVYLARVVAIMAECFLAKHATTNIIATTIKIAIAPGCLLQHHLKLSITLLVAYTAFVVSCSRNVEAAAWLVPEGKLHSYFTILHYTSDKFYDEQHKLQPQSKYSKYELSGYFEYGYSSSITLGSKLAVNTTTSDDFTEWNIGLSDTELFIRKLIWQNDNSVLSIQPLLKTPTISRDDRLPRSGTKEWDAEIRLLAGTNCILLEYKCFANAELAYRKRFGKAADQIGFDFTMGLDITKNLTILPQIFTIWRTSTPNRSFRTQIFDNDYNLIKAQISAVYKINNSLALQAGFFRDAYGQNIGQGNGFFISTWHKF